MAQLYTKAYELFKKHRTAQGRLTFHIAYRIAETYYTSGKYDMAVKCVFLFLHGLVLDLVFVSDSLSGSRRPTDEKNGEQCCSLYYQCGMTAVDN